MKYSWKTPMRIRLRLWWHRLWIREDEFHASLNMDAEAMECMSSGQLADYLKDLLRRRKIAHNRDIDNGHT